MQGEWFLEDSERAALEGVSLDAFKRDVIAHARRKLVLSRTMDDAEWARVAGAMFDRTHGWLKAYDTVLYESYVFMVMLYFIRGIDGIGADYVQ